MYCFHSPRNAIKNHLSKSRPKCNRAETKFSCGYLIKKQQIKNAKSRKQENQKQIQTGDEIIEEPGRSKESDDER